ncbi:MAG: rod shape-determining protein RodA [Spirochaetales bacterium]
MSNETTRAPLPIDSLLLICILGLMTIGILFIYSSGVNSSGVLISSEYLRQLLWSALALAVLVVFSYFNYNLLRDFSLWIYLVFLILLVLTLFFGKVVNGARAWLGIFGLGGQPSEFAKIATILFLARFLESRRAKIGDWKVFLQAFLIVSIPMVLILRQPDTGTTLVFIPVFLLMVFMAGGKFRHLFFVAATGIASLVLALVPFVETIIYHESDGIGSLLVNWKTMLVVGGFLLTILGVAAYGWLRLKRRVFYWILFLSSILALALVVSSGLRLVLKEYQIMRFIVFLDPSIDPRDSGWNLIQSITAIGSGGFSGKGWLAGTQSHLRFLPMQSTDFIFSVVGEEWGFLGGLLVFGLFLAILFRFLFIMQAIRDRYGVIVISGFIGVIFTHVFVNVGMTVGIMPVTGIPLYFLSYGGSSLLAACMMMGIVMNIHHRRFMF